MYFDMTYLILVLPAVLFSLWAQWRVNSTFKKYSKVNSQRGLTGADVARKILDANGLHNVMIQKVPGELTDHYDPSANVIRLSDSVYDKTSAAAIGVAAHEVGHAIQYDQDYAPIKLRAAIIPISQIGSKLSIPLLIIGFLLSSFSRSLIAISYIGLILFATVALFQLVTLPTEFDASKRALQTIDEMHLLTVDEYTGSKKVLSAAAMTYVAALAVTLMQLLRFAMMLSRRD